MTNIRRALRVDANQTAVVSALQAAGASVYVLGQPLDLLVSKQGRTMLVEVKNPKTGYGRAGLNKKQADFAKDWQGIIAQVDGPEAALTALRTLMA